MRTTTAALALALALCTSAVAVPTPLNTSLTGEHARKHCTGACRHGDPNSLMHGLMHVKLEQHAKCVHEHRCPTVRPSTIATTPCVNSYAGEYQCDGVDMLGFVSLEDLGAGAEAGGNDIWGWTDPTNGNEIAVMGLSDGTAFVDVTNPVAPVVLGNLPTATVSSLWRDIKIYRDFAYIGAEANGHGMQVFDLKTLRQFYGKDARGSSIRTLNAASWYEEFGNSHNLAINANTGFGFAIGSQTCNGGPHMIDLHTDPANPEFVGCAGSDGYTHDAECVTYRGPDLPFTGHEICFLYNENTLTIMDVEDKENPVMLSRVPYEDVHYTHQGWLMEDHTHLFLDDELDELNGANQHTRTLIWDVTNLRQPVHTSSFFSEMTVSDHNQYVNGTHVFQSNYCAGLRILAIERVGGPQQDVSLRQVGYFDNSPDCDTVGFEGTWSNYPYFSSGIVVLTSMERGLFVLDPAAALAAL